MRTSYAEVLSSIFYNLRRVWYNIQSRRENGKSLSILQKEHSIYQTLATTISLDQDTLDQDTIELIEQLGFSLYDPDKTYPNNKIMSGDETYSHVSIDDKTIPLRYLVVTTGGYVMDIRYVILALKKHNPLIYHRSHRQREEELICRTPEEFDIFCKLEKRILKTDSLSQIRQELITLKKYYLSIGILEETVNVFSLVAQFMRFPFFGGYKDKHFGLITPPEGKWVDTEMLKGVRLMELFDYLNKHPEQKKCLEAFKARDHLNIPTVVGSRDTNYEQCNIGKKNPHEKYAKSYYNNLLDVLRNVAEGDVCHADEFRPVVEDCFSSIAFLVQIEDKTES